MQRLFMLALALVFWVNTHTAKAGECVIQYDNGNHADKCGISEDQCSTIAGGGGGTYYYYPKECGTPFDDGVPIVNYDRNRTSLLISMKPYGDGKDHNCSNGRFFAPIGEWLPKDLTIDTRDDGGGCEIAFGLYDPQKLFAGTGSRLSVNFADGGTPTGECAATGSHTVPVIDDSSKDPRELGITWPPFNDDTDNRAEWCNMTFQFTGSDVFELDVAFVALGAAKECINAASKEAPMLVSLNSSPPTIGLDTDGGPLGCALNFRLRKVK